MARRTWAIHPSQSKTLRTTSVAVDRQSVRVYPYGSLAAHVLGTVGRITGDELKSYTGPAAKA